MAWPVTVRFICAHGILLGGMSTGLRRGYGQFPLDTIFKQLTPLALLSLYYKASFRSRHRPVVGHCQTFVVATRVRPGAAGPSTGLGLTQIGHAWRTVRSYGC
jgi:hypothetical protein